MQDRKAFTLCLSTLQVIAQHEENLYIEMEWLLHELSQAWAFRKAVQVVASLQNLPETSSYSSPPRRSAKVKRTSFNNL